MRHSNDMLDEFSIKTKSLPIFSVSSNYDLPKDWTLYDKDVYINNALFEFGVTAVVPASEASWLSKIGPNNIHFYGQTNSSDMINDTLRVNIDPATNLLFSLNDTESLPSETESVASELESSKRVLMFFSKNSLPKPESQKSKISPDKFLEYDVSLLAEPKSTHQPAHMQELSLPRRRELRHSIHQNMRCLETLATYANKKNPGSVLICKDHKDQFLICNPERRSEVFLPISINGMGSYLCLSNNKIGNQFTGVNDFVTAGCLFGATLEARNNAKGHYPLIKHEKTFFPGEYITGIIYNPQQSGAYEDSLFFELTKLCHLIDALADNNKPKNLTFHIPYYDYILYAFKLFLDGNITQNACDEFIVHIFSKTNQYTRKITELCKKHNINVNCISPFINLFGNPVDIMAPSCSLTRALFEKLKFPIPEIPAHLPLKKPSKDNEKYFVQRCLRQLVENTLDTNHRQVWQDFIRAHARAFVQKHLINLEQNKLKSGAEEYKLTETDILFTNLAKKDPNIYTIDDIISIGSINTLEDLLKIANALIIAMAAKNHPANKICSALPQTERIIQSSYAQLRNKEGLRDHYPPVLNITTLDPLLAYSGATNGSVFYLDLAAEKVCELINKKNVLVEASRNIHQAISGKAPQAISDIVNEDMSPYSSSPKSPSSSPASHSGSPDSQMSITPQTIQQTRNLSSPLQIMSSLSSPTPEKSDVKIIASAATSSSSYDELRKQHDAKIQKSEITTVTTRNDNIHNVKP